ncbi:hypothetical protein HPP92_010679 [Vanilla planifolia]|uniref:Uncharacterized protein n=1 Tax=Vanilla planifolia TaxID=51239 RepID=A0A835R6Y6_VANPL|nr:hypothetical protein HPP92_010679 [Vanilla planifolia]
MESDGKTAVRDRSSGRRWDSWRQCLIRALDGDKIGLLRRLGCDLSTAVQSFGILFIHGEL